MNPIRNIEIDLSLSGYERNNDQNRFKEFGIDGEFGLFGEKNDDICVSGKTDIDDELTMIFTFTPEHILRIFNKINKNMLTIYNIYQNTILLFNNKHNVNLEIKIPFNFINFDRVNVNDTNNMNYIRNQFITIIRNIWFHYHPNDPKNNIQFLQSAFRQIEEFNPYFPNYLYPYLFYYIFPNQNIRMCEDENNILEKFHEKYNKAIFVYNLLNFDSNHISPIKTNNLLSDIEPQNDITPETTQRNVFERLSTLSNSFLPLLNRDPNIGEYEKNPIRFWIFRKQYLPQGVDIIEYIAEIENNVHTIQSQFVKMNKTLTGQKLVPILLKSNNRGEHEKKKKILGYPLGYFESNNNNESVNCILENTNNIKLQHKNFINHNNIYEKIINTYPSQFIEIMKSLDTEIKKIYDKRGIYVSLPIFLNNDEKFIYPATILKPLIEFIWENALSENALSENALSENEEININTIILKYFETKSNSSIQNYLSYFHPILFPKIIYEVFPNNIIGENQIGESKSPKMVVYNQSIVFPQNMEYFDIVNNRLQYFKGTSSSRSSRVINNKSNLNQVKLIPKSQSLSGGNKYINIDKFFFNLDNSLRSKKEKRSRPIRSIRSFKNIGKNIIKSKKEPLSDKELTMKDWLIMKDWLKDNIIKVKKYTEKYEKTYKVNQLLDRYLLAHAARRFKTFKSLGKLKENKVMKEDIQFHLSLIEYCVTKSFLRYSSVHMLNETREHSFENFENNTLLEKIIKSFGENILTDQSLLMEYPDEITMVYNKIILFYLKSSKDTEVINLFKEMIEKEIKFDPETYEFIMLLLMMSFSSKNQQANARIIQNNKDPRKPFLPIPPSLLEGTPNNYKNSLVRTLDINTLFICLIFYILINKGLIPNTNIIDMFYYSMNIINNNIEYYNQLFRGGIINIKIRNSMECSDIYQFLQGEILSVKNNYIDLEANLINEMVLDFEQNGEKLYKLCLNREFLQEKRLLCYIRLGNKKLLTNQSISTTNTTSSTSSTSSTSYMGRRKTI